MVRWRTFPPSIPFFSPRAVAVVRLVATRFSGTAPVFAVDENNMRRLFGRGSVSLQAKIFLRVLSPKYVCSLPF